MGASDDAGNARACAFLEVARPSGGGDCYGVGIDGNIVTASIKALVSAANRAGAAVFAGEASRAA